MFEGFTTERVHANGVDVHLRAAGSGPPLLLIHGYPQTHVMWHLVAPMLVDRFTVVCPDLRGYGDSAKPHGDGRTTYAKRTMAQDLVEVMGHLGFPQFGVAGHDRGARVAYRMALDHPDRVAKLAVLDIVPTAATFRAMDWRSALAAHHWLFLAQPEPLPERLIGGDPVFWMRSRLAAWAAPGFRFAPEALAAYDRSFADPASIHATCEDYRAGATLDVELDEADFGRRRITCPVLVLWGDGRSGGRRPGILETWREWALDVRGHGLPCGHFLPEEAPRETADALGAFFTA